MGLWIINDKTLSTITISFSRFIPSYNDENYKNDIVDIYCVRLPESCELIRNRGENKYPSAIALK